MGYDQILISDLEIMAGANNYRRWMFRRLVPHIGQSVLEIGAGIGNFTKLLLEREFVLATDNYEPCIEYLNQQLGDQLKAPAMLFDVAANGVPELKQYKFDTIVCLNVLEHIEDDLRDSVSDARDVGAGWASGFARASVSISLWNGRPSPRSPSPVYPERFAPGNETGRLCD